ncbi:MAG: MarR family transcriptional regulator [Gammaproteobacteria bacterium]|nr:MarR family transcriptional regulator [Gammaproteobacteria bacterium]MDH5691489.1 MarR family transcriptional regulator [Gammaproteobacteria bacterium]
MKEIIQDTSATLVKKGATKSERDELAKAVLQNLRVVVRTTQAHSRWIEKSSGITGAQLWALWELFAQPGQKVSDLSRALSIHQSTASNMLDKLEERGLIRRDRSGPDQRVVQLFLTREGTDLLSDAPRPAQGAIMDALKSMSNGDLLNLNQGLNSLLDHMQVWEKNAALNPLS